MYNKIGILIKRERENMGLSQKELAEKANYNSYQIILKMEKGERNITIDDLYKISKALNLNPEYFLKLSNTTERPVLWRERKDFKKSKMYENKFKMYVSNYLHLNKLLDKKYKPFIPYSIEKLNNIFRDHNRYESASQLANLIRTEFNLGDYPASNLVRTIIDKGILIFIFNMEDNGSAASYVGEEGAAILLNKQNTPWRKNFDIAHELYHILTWNFYDFGNKEYNLSENDLEEKVANAFAANLLMPEEVIRSEVNRNDSSDKIDYFCVLKMALKFKVSIEALVNRLEYLGLIRKDHKQSLINDDIKRIFWRQYNAENNYDMELKTEDEFPFSYLITVYSAYKKAKLSKMKLAEYLNKNIGEIDYYLRERGMA